MSDDERLRLWESLAEADKALAEARAENERLRAALDGFASSVEAAERHFARPAGGMQVPYHDDWTGVDRMPSVRSRLGWWARRMRAALSPHVPSYPGPSDACGYCGKMCIKGEVCPARPTGGPRGD